MKTIIAGSRWIQDPVLIVNAVKNSGFKITEVVSGGCRGPDRFGEVCAKALKVPVKRFNANWKQFGKGAGPIRNRQMAKYAEALIAVWDGESKGTHNMIIQARHHGLKVYIEHIP